MGHLGLDSERPEACFEWSRRVTAFDYDAAEVERQITRYFQQHDCPELTVPVLEMFKELLQNTVKANIKRLIFDDSKLDPFKSDEYAIGMVLFQESFHDPHEFSRCLDQLITREITFTVTIEYGTSGLTLEVRNPRRLFPEEEERIREKFAKWESAQTLFEFCNENEDREEGAGMGIALILTMLKRLGFDSGSLSIHNETDSNHTVSRIVIPIDFQ